MAKSFTLPISSNSPLAFSNGDATMLDAVKLDVTCLLLTRRGERIFNSTVYGSLDQFLFEPNSSALESSIKIHIKSKIEKFIPYLDVDDVITRQTNEVLEVSIVLSFKNGILPPFTVNLPLEKLNG